MINGIDEGENRMKIKICSRKTIEKVLSNGKIEGAGVISFHDPEGRGRNDYKPIDFKRKCERVIQVGVHDLDPRSLSGFGLSIETYFPEADEIADFVYRAKAEGLDIICQCEYGQSRSAGCAAAILQHFSKKGIEIFADYRYYPNQLIYNKMLAALDERKLGEGE